MKEVTLKAGDRVLSDSRYHGYAIETVARVTKTTAILEDGTILRNNPFRYGRAKGDRVISNVLNGKHEEFIIIRTDCESQTLNVLIKADYDDLEIWVTDTTLTKIEN